MLGNMPVPELSTGGLVLLKLVCEIITDKVLSEQLNQGRDPSSNYSKVSM
jgi:hypothetical protein